MNVYFDNAATTPLHPKVKAKMIDVIENAYGNPSSIHKQGRQSKIIIEDARKTIAQCIQASTGEVFFTSGATEANNMVLMCSIRDLGVKHIISTTTEHHCVLHTLEYIDSNNLAKVTMLPVDECGHINYDQFEEVLSSTEGLALVSMMHVNNEIGTMHDIERISEVATRHNALFHCDTCQSVGKQPLDVSKLNINFLTGSGHKFYGPKGVGFIYIKNENMIKTLIHGGSQERGIRSGTENLYGIAGMSLALKLAIENMDADREHITKLKNHFINRVQEELVDAIINGCPEKSAYNILSISFPKTEKSDLLMMNLDISGVCASAGSACSSGVENGSHVMEAIGHDPLRKTVRFSFSHFNTMEEIDYTVDQLKKYTPARELV